MHVRTCNSRNYGTVKNHGTVGSMEHWYIYSHVYIQCYNNSAYFVSVL